MRRALLQDGDLMAEGNDLRLLSSTGSKCRADQSQKSDGKWSHGGNDDDLAHGARTCIFNPDGFSVSTGEARKVEARVRALRAKSDSDNPARFEVGCRNL